MTCEAATTVFSVDDMCSAFNAIYGRRDTSELEQQRAECRRVKAELDEAQTRLSVVAVMIESGRWNDHARLVASGALSPSEALDLVRRHGVTPEDWRLADRIGEMLSAVGGDH